MESDRQASFRYLMHLADIRNLQNLKIPDVPEGNRTGGFSSTHVDNSGNVVTWSYMDLFVNWSENTSIHGIKFVTERSDLKSRKFAWLLVVLVFSTLLTIQVSSRVQYYFSNQKSVRVEVITNKSITFPVITFCNENKFKMSSSALVGLNDALTEIYDEKNHTFNSIPERIANMSMAVIVQKTRFDLTDMLLECYWKGQVCSEKNFTVIRTDQGECYSFNLAENGNDILTITDSGMDNGLSILLNVQQYDYLPMKFGAAGIRFLAHSHIEQPLISDIGMAASTGSHTFVNLKAVQSNKLKKPYDGACTERKLQHFPVYHESNCILECRTELYIRRCGCVQPYQFIIGRSMRPNVMVCTLYEEINCIKNAKEEFRMSYRPTCECGVACNTLRYDPSLSYSAMANPERIFENILPNISKDNRRARNILSNIDDNWHQFDQRQILAFSEAVDVLKVAFGDNLPHFLDMTYRQVDKIVSQVERAMRTKVNLLKQQVNLVEHGFMQQYLWSNEKTFSLVGHGLFSFTIHLQRYIERLSSLPKSQNNIREQILFFSSISIFIRRECEKAAVSKLKRLDKCYYEGVPCVSEFDESDKTMSTIPKPLLRKASLITVNNVSSQDLVYILRNMTSALTSIEMSFNATFETGNYNSTQFNKFIHSYIDNAKLWIKHSTVIMMKKFVQPFRDMQNKYEEFRRLLTKVQTDKFIFLSSLTIMKSASHTKSSLNILTIFQEKSRSLLNCTLPGWDQCPFHKDDFATEMERNHLKLANAISSLEEISSTVRIQQNTWRKLIESMRVREKNTWSFILGDSNAQDQYLYHHLPWRKIHMTHKLAEIQHEYEEISNGFSELDLMSSASLNVTRTLIDLKNSLAEYNLKNKLTSQFFIDNLVDIKFFFKDMNFQRITEQPAYELTALLSDVGGTLGLFVGMSLLSLIEVFDLIAQILYHRPKKIPQEVPEEAVKCMIKADETTEFDLPIKENNEETTPLKSHLPDEEDNTDNYPIETAVRINGFEDIPDIESDEDAVQ